MGKRVESRRRIVQKSTGYELRQLEFFNWCEERGIIHIEDMKITFKSDPFVRDAVDKQIEIISGYYPEAKQFLKNEK